MLCPRLFIYFPANCHLFLNVFCIFTLINNKEQLQLPTKQQQSFNL